MAKANSKKNAEMTFENAMTDLEAVVAKLEAGELTLQESLLTFESGMELAAFCEQALQDANGKIEKIIKDAAGQENRVNVTPDEIAALKE